MEVNFSGKRVLVAGTGNGIGHDLVKRLVSLGAHVVALSSNQSNLNSLKEECPNIEIVSVDVGDWNATKNAVESLGPIDLLVNNTGVLITETFGEVTEENTNRIIAINVKGPINIMQVVAKGMHERGTGGSIVNVTCATLQNESVVYNSCKTALERVSRLASLTLGPQKIRVNTVSLGIVETEVNKMFLTDENKCKMVKSQIPLRDFIHAKDVVDAIIFLLSDNAAMIHGTCLQVDGGMIAH